MFIYIYIYIYIYLCVHVSWELYALQIVEIFLWENLKETSYVHVVKHFQIFIVDLLTIYFYSRMGAKHSY